jgi:hypothetical protein
MLNRVMGNVRERGDARHSSPRGMRRMEILSSAEWHGRAGNVWLSKEKTALHSRGIPCLREAVDPPLIWVIRWPRSERVDAQ